MKYINELTSEFLPYPDNLSLETEKLHIDCSLFGETYSLNAQAFSYLENDFQKGVAKLNPHESLATFNDSDQLYTLNDIHKIHQETIEATLKKNFLNKKNHTTTKDIQEKKALFNTLLQEKKQILETLNIKLQDQNRQLNIHKVDLTKLQNQENTAIKHFLENTVHSSLPDSKEPHQLKSDLMAKISNLQKQTQSTEEQIKEVEKLQPYPDPQCQIDISSHNDYSYEALIHTYNKAEDAQKNAPDLSQNPEAITGPVEALPYNQIRLHKIRLEAQYDPWLKKLHQTPFTPSLLTLRDKRGYLPRILGLSIGSITTLWVISRLFTHAHSWILLNSINPGPALICNLCITTSLTCLTLGVTIRLARNFARKTYLNGLIHKIQKLSTSQAPWNNVTPSSHLEYSIRQASAPPIDISIPHAIPINEEDQIPSTTNTIKN